MNLTMVDVLDRMPELLPTVPNALYAWPEAAAMLAASLNADAYGESWEETTRAHDAGLFTLDRPDPRKFDSVKGGGVPDLAHGPVAWSARQHGVKVKRSNSGRTVITVIRSGMATVQGAEHTTGCTTDAASVWVPGLVAVLDDRNRYSMVRRARHDRVAIDVLRVTDAAYAVHGVPSLLGTDAPTRRGSMFPELIDTGFYSDPLPADAPHSHRMGVVTPDACRVAHRNAGLSGMAHDATLDRFAAHSDVYTSHTEGLDWPMRVLRAPRARDSEKVLIGPHSGVTRLLASTGEPDTVWIGHSKITRPPRAAVVRRGKRAARTIGTVDAPTTIQGWETLLDHLTAGERIVCTDITGQVTVTRSKSGRYSATDTRPDGLTVRCARTITSVALKLTR